VTLISCVTLFFLSLNSCAYHQTELFPIADVLKPSEAVEIIGFTEDGDIIVNREFMYWVESLKQEIVRLRKEIEKLKGDW